MLSKKKAKDLWKEWVEAEAVILISKSKGATSSVTKIAGDIRIVDALFASLAERMMTNKIHTRDELVDLIDKAIKAKEMRDNESK